MNKMRLLGLLILIGIITCMITLCVDKSRLVICKDDRILSLLKNDENSAEFVLDRVYYQLPVELGEFQANGWKLSSEQQGEVILAGSYKDNMKLVKNSKEILVKLVNDDSQHRCARDSELVVTKIEVWGGDTDYFVMKNGVAMGTERDDIAMLWNNYRGYYDYFSDWDPSAHRVELGKIYKIYFSRDDTVIQVEVFGK